MMRSKTFTTARAVALAGAYMAGAVWPSDSPALATGNSITTPHSDLISAVGFYTSVALDASGFPVVSYSSNSISLYVLHCNDPNCAGNDDSITATDGAFVNVAFTSLELDAAGNPVVSYFDYIGNYDLKVLHCNDPFCDGGDESLWAPDTEGLVGAYTSLELDASGNPVVSYFEGDPNYDLKLLHCNDPNCAGGDDSITAPDMTGLVGWFTSLALDTTGNPVVSYMDIATNDMKLLHCNDANCAGGDDSVTTPDMVGDVGWNTSLALDSSGNPVVSYVDDGSNQLKLLRCNDALCSGGDDSIVALDSAYYDGNTTSLVLDKADNPVVSYYDHPDGEVKVLHCNEPRCIGGDESIATPDLSGNGGRYTWLVLDSAGNPVVSYYVVTKGDLNLLHCSDPVCLGNKPKDPDSDTDGDTALNGSDPDDDNDGCPDAQELQSAVGSQGSGGLRSAHSYWDFFDVPAGPSLIRDASVSSLDIFAVLSRFNSTGNVNIDPLSMQAPVPSYHTAYDRGSVIGQNVWNLGAANGSIAATDIFSVLGQFGHSCA